AGGDDELAGGDPVSATEAQRLGLRGREHKALLRQTQVAARRPHDPPDEEIEQDEEEELQDQERLADRDRRRHSASLRSNSRSLEPTVSMSPDSSFARAVRWPFTCEPLVESRSINQYAEPSWRSSAWRRETFGSASWMSQSLERPITNRRLSISCCVPL